MASWLYECLAAYKHINLCNFWYNMHVYIWFIIVSYPISLFIISDWRLQSSQIAVHTNPFHGSQHLHILCMYGKKGTNLDFWKYEPTESHNELGSLFELEQLCMKLLTKKNCSMTHPFFSCTFPSLRLSFSLPPSLPLPLCPPLSCTYTPYVDVLCWPMLNDVHRVMLCCEY